MNGYSQKGTVQCAVEFSRMLTCQKCCTAIAAKGMNMLKITGYDVKHVMQTYAACT